MRELLSKKKLGRDDLRNSWSIQNAKVSKSRKFTVRKALSGKKAKDVARQPFASALEEIKVHDIQSHRGGSLKRLGI